MSLGPPPLDYEYAIKRIKQFLKDFMVKTGVKGYVMGLSGGVDSSTVLHLAVEAVGTNKVHVFIMPDPAVTPMRDIEDSVGLVQKLKVDYTIISINNILDAYRATLPFFSEEHRIATGNLRARIRMTILYYYANMNDLAVLGTGDKSEILLGYYTKYGDGGVDLLPIGDVYKTQVRVMARKLGVPEKIVTKPSSPRLWPGHMAEEELGVKYEEVDAVLYRYVDLGKTINEIIEETGFPRSKVLHIIRMVHLNEHKRLYPIIPRISKHAITHDWKMPWYLRLDM